MASYNQPRAGEWRHGLFDCCGSCSDCLCASFCPNCFAYCAAQEAGEGTLMSCIHCFTFPFCLCCLRGAARGKHGIEGGCLGDCLVSLFCPCCVAIQVKREFTD
ncbi:unnamed protein product [Brachionus calyciflorus]|uniref:Uncharacterized protein n=1 Tax=Brachionus calyciflorus TaxID=104777 RepID=A0A813V6R0_9BILA|nr:unnamed protein product [Brachionus calyciflorus]